MRRLGKATALVALGCAAAPATAAAERFTGKTPQVAENAISLTTTGPLISEMQWRWKLRCSQASATELDITTNYDSKSPDAEPIRLTAGRFASGGTGPLRLEKRPGLKAAVRSSISGYVRNGVATGTFRQTITVTNAANQVVATCSTGRVPWVARRAPAPRARPAPAPRS